MEGVTTKTLYRMLLDSGINECDIHNHYSDMYIPVTEASTAIIKAYVDTYQIKEPTFPCRGYRYLHWPRGMPEAFQSQIPGEGLMYDIPFAYDPYWNSILKHNWLEKPHHK